MIAPTLLAFANPSFAFARGHTVREEKMSHIAILGAQQRRWRALFDAVAGAALVIADDRVLTISQQGDLVVALVRTQPVLAIADLTQMIVELADAIADGKRVVITQLIERGRPRDANTVWATAGKMVEIVRHVRPLDDETIERLLVVIKMVGEHPLMAWRPS